MGQLVVVPVWAPLHDPDRVLEAIDRVLGWLSGLAGYSVRLAEGRVALPGMTAGGCREGRCRPGPEGGEHTAYLVLTGGTERALLSLVEGRRGPVILLAHPGQNSLPAALEAASHLRSAGRRVQVVYLAGEGDAAGLESHLRVEDARRWMRSARLGLVGGPSRWLVASSPDPGRVTATWGTTVVPVEMEELFSRLEGVDPRRGGEVADEFLAGARGAGRRSGGPSARDGEVGPEEVRRAARVYLALRGLVEDHRLDAVTVRCFDLLGPSGTTGCLALSRLNDEGVVAACEGDLPAAVTMMLLRRLTGEPAFMGNPARLDRRRGTLWLAHCTVARRLVSSYTLRTHFESGTGVGVAGELRPGPVTVARVGGPDLGAVLAEEGELLRPAHEEDLCRTQAVVRCPAAVEAILDAPLGNHHVLAYGRVAREVRALVEAAAAGSAEGVPG